MYLFLYTFKNVFWIKGNVHQSQKWKTLLIFYNTGILLNISINKELANQIHYIFKGINAHVVHCIYQTACTITIHHDYGLVYYNLTQLFDRQSCFIIFVFTNCFQLTANKSKLLMQILFDSCCCICFPSFCNVSYTLLCSVKSLLIFCCVGLHQYCKFVFSTQWMIFEHWCFCETKLDVYRWTFRLLRKCQYRKSHHTADLSWHGITLFITCRRKMIQHQTTTHAGLITEWYFIQCECVCFIVVDLCSACNFIFSLIAA